MKRSKSRLAEALEKFNGSRIVNGGQISIFFVIEIVIKELMIWAQLPECFQDIAERGD